MTPDSTYRWPSLAAGVSAGQPATPAAADSDAERQTARAEGYQQGFEEGLAKGQAQAQADAEQRLSQLTQELTEVREAMARALADAQATLPLLVANLLRALALDGVAQEPAFCEGLLQEAAQRLDLAGDELTLAVGADWASAQPELAPCLDPKLDAGRIELRGQKAFARLDLQALIFEIMQAQHRPVDDDG